MLIGFARLNIEAPDFDETESLLNNNWIPHFNKRDYSGDWNVLTLRSPGGSMDNIFAELNGISAFEDTEHMSNFPSVKKLLGRLNCETMSVRLLNLKAGAVINQHRDKELAFENGEARLHFPIITNPKVEFYVNNVRVNMLPGECWYINANMPHRVANYSDTDRIHLVIDCKVNQWLSDAFAASKKTEFTELVNIEQTWQVIHALRGHQTETANQLANKMELELRTLS